MKKFSLILLFLVFMLLFGCTMEEGPISESTKYHITLVDGVTKEETEMVTSRIRIKAMNLDAELKEGYLLIGWQLGDIVYDTDAEIPVTDGMVLTSVWKEVESYASFFEVGSIAKIEISATDAITSKEDYVTGSISITDEDTKLNNVPISIRLRGNSSLTCPKKSYKIKFDSKQDLFGFGKDKEWALIANYFDPAMVRNFYAYRLAKAMGMEFAVDCKYAEVYLNGDLLGLYLVCETVKTGSNRVDIEADYDENATDIPFLLELDFKMISESDPESNGIENTDYFMMDLRSLGGKNYPIACKYPKTYKKITKTQYENLKNEVYNAFVSTKNKTYADYFDVDSLVDYFIIQELFMNIDLDHSSVFFYKKMGEKIKMGPVWDFDISVGNANYVNNYSYDVLMKNVNGGSFLLNNLLKDQAFKTKYINRLKELQQEILPAMFASFEATYRALETYELRDNGVWHNLFAEYWPKPDYLVGPTYYQQVIYVRYYLQKHAEAMLELIK